MAVFIHVSERDSVRAGLTSDVDAAIDRQHLPAVISAATQVGLSYRHVAGVGMRVNASQPRAPSAIRLVFLREVPASPPARTREGILPAPVEDLVRMKLTSFRLKNQVHMQDLDAVGLITAEIESLLSHDLMRRLREVRARQ